MQLFSSDVYTLRSTSMKAYHRNLYHEYEGQNGGNTSCMNLSTKLLACNII